MDSQSLAVKAEEFLKKHPKVELIMGDKLVMEPPDAVVVHCAKTVFPDGDYLKVNIATPQFESEFDWKIEFTTASEHYLILKNDQIVRTVRKDFFPVTDSEISFLNTMLDKALAFLTA